MKLIGTCAAVIVAAVGIQGAAPIRYRVSFPEPQHRWMQVEATFPDIGAGTLELRMSRSSPGRYSLHDFAKNVYDVHAFGADRPRARDDPAGSVRLERQRPRRRRHREVQGLRRSRGRHVSRRRPDPRAHQHARGDDVGARPGRTADRHRLRAAGRIATGRSRRSCTPDRRRSSSRRPTCSTSWTARWSSARSPCASSPSAAGVSGLRCTTPGPTPSSTAS